MPANKSQHFVPQFYLRHFAADADRKTIQVFNIKAEKVVSRRAPISGQCARDYFYSPDLRVETFLRELETKAAPIIAYIVKERRLPQRGTPDHKALIEFVSIQLGRTTAHETEMNQLADQLARYVFVTTHPELKDAADRVSLQLTNASVLGALDSFVLAPILWDLRFELLTSDAGRFITSDNPCIVFNPLFDERTPWATRGIASIGLQIYLPLAPTVALLLYDSSVYRVGSRSDVTTAATDGDAIMLNALQYLHADANVYFTRDDQRLGVETIAREHLRRRPGEVSKFEIVAKEKTGGGSRELATFRSNRPRVKVKISSMKLKRRVAAVAQPGVRRPVWTQIVREFADQLREGGETNLTLFVSCHRLHSAVEQF